MHLQLNLPGQPVITGSVTCGNAKQKSSKLERHEIPTTLKLNLNYYVIVIHFNFRCDCAACALERSVFAGVSGTGRARLPCIKKLFGAVRFAQTAAELG